MTSVALVAEELKCYGFESVEATILENGMYVGLCMEEVGSTCSIQGKGLMNQLE
mgnify:CR=1 FL=1